MIITDASKNVIKSGIFNLELVNNKNVKYG